MFKLHNQDKNIKQWNSDRFTVKLYTVYQSNVYQLFVIPPYVAT